MKRRTAVVLGIVLAVLLVAGAAQAQTPLVRVVLGSSNITGEGWGDGKEVKATLRSAAGQIKGACWVRTYTDGGFDCSWGQSIFLAAGVLPPATSQPGDTLSIEHEGSTYASGAFARVRIARLDPVADLVVGSVAPRRANVRVRVFPSVRLRETGYVYPAPYAKVATTNAAGAFAIDLTSVGNPGRNDRIFVGHVQGRFEIGVAASFPGLDVFKDSNVGYLSGIPDTVRTVRLYGPGAVLKSQARVTLGSLMGPSASARAQKGEVGRNGLGGAMGVFSFKDASGSPVRIREGDVISVDGTSGFTFRVPKLSPNITTEHFTVRTLPNWPVQFSGSIHSGPGLGYGYVSAYGKTGATGLYRYDPLPAITPYSTCGFMIMVEGHRVSTARTLAP